MFLQPHEMVFGNWYHYSFGGFNGHESAAVKVFGVSILAKGGLIFMIIKYL